MLPQWVSTSDWCHRSAIFSYALNSTAIDKSQWVADFNHFVIFDAESLMACHDFEYLDLMPVSVPVSCHTQEAGVVRLALHLGNARNR